MVDYDEMDIYAFGDEQLDDVSEDEDMNPFSIGYVKEAERARDVVEEDKLPDED